MREEGDMKAVSVSNPLQCQAIRSGGESQGCL